MYCSKVSLLRTRVYGTCLLYLINLFYIFYIYYISTACVLHVQEFYYYYYHLKFLRCRAKSRSSLHEVVVILTIVLSDFLLLESPPIHQILRL